MKYDILLNYITKLNNMKNKLNMGPANIKWVQYYFSPKCVGFEPFYKVGPVVSF
jgi:hypothetical protein